MIAKYNRKSLALGIPGLVLQLGCIFANNMITAKVKSGGAAPSDSLALLIGVGTLVGALLLIFGLGFYAKAKGYSTVWGILGLLSCIGLLILALLPDKTKGKTDDIVV